MSYQGPLADTVRHGGGGRYSFRNRYFTYEGGYDRGVRSGWGRLVLGLDPANPDCVVEGPFVNGELEGLGNKMWADGSVFVGHFSRGEPHGEGRLEHAPSGSLFEGNFEMGTASGGEIHERPVRDVLVVS